MSYADIKKHIVNKMVNGNVGNALRFFLAGVWENYSKKETHFPFKRNKAGIFMLPDPTRVREQMPDKINPIWLGTVISRIKLFASRGIFVGIDLIDNCSLHLYRGSHWGSHWMNPANNDQNTHPEAASMYHYYEYWPGGACEQDHPPEEREKWWASGVILEEFYRYSIKTIWENLTKFERMFVGFNAGNEVVAGYGWHLRMATIVHGATGQKRFPHWKMITSMAIVSDWFLYKKATHKHFKYAVHGVGCLNTYNEAVKALGPVKFLPSCDGFKWISPSQAKALTLKFLEDGQFGYELLEGVWDQYAKVKAGEHYDFSKINWKPGRQAMAALVKYLVLYA